MPDFTPTWRTVEGDVVRGRQRLIFVRKRDHYDLAPLSVFADGVVTWQWDRSDVDGLRAALDDGTLTLSPPSDASIIVVGTARGSASLETWLTPDLLLGDIADELDRLNDRPDSSRRCFDALIAYAADPTAANLEIVRERYHEVPAHRRIYMLGDMDQNDVPVRILLAEPGTEIPARHPDHTFTVTPSEREWALDYFRRAEKAVAESRSRKAADGPESAIPLRVGGSVFPNGWPAPPGPEQLQTDYPAPVTHGGREYTSVMHAYWALSTDDPAWHDRIASEPRGLDARSLAADAPRRPNWPAIRLGVMAALLRDKFTRHPAMAEELTRTGDTRLIYVDWGSAYWSSDGTNWLGRLLELVRSELAGR
ncbi:NADAR family protein [Actinoplanes sp. LDG1-06]|uniref:NADAR family protein n=1 Tax=Paractinoplanes ovalisporus TaxID=2810368 RepID=A0ABS2AV98_9ACTN|nr:NADAR family protein [Actinoplanes ovalisporus]MBM2623074.1 NADAR family protein [Actinoplanes ovalisporus]